MFDNAPSILVDGEPLDSIAVSDRAIHYGDGLFETIAISHGRPQLWSAHMERLLAGCSRLGIPLPDLQRLAAESEQLCRDHSQAILKVIITRGSGGRGYRSPAQPAPRRVVIRYPWPAMPDWQQGVRLRWCRTPLGCNPLLAGIKHLNRLEQVLARNEWQDEGIYEGLMCDPQGHLVEGTMSNLFAWRDGVLYTPDLSHCGVAGVMRQQLLAMAQQMGMRCEHLRQQGPAWEGMEELMISNSLIGVVPVSQLGEQRFEIRRGLELRRAMQSWLEGR